MANRVTFDFDTNEVEYEFGEENGIQIQPDLKDRKEAIMKAAGFENINMEELRTDINALFADLGIECECAEPNNSNLYEKGLEKQNSIITDKSKHPNGFVLGKPGGSGKA